MIIIGAMITKCSNETNDGMALSFGVDETSAIDSGVECATIRSGGGGGEGSD